MVCALSGAAAASMVDARLGPRGGCGGACELAGVGAGARASSSASENALGVCSRTAQAHRRRIHIRVEGVEDEVVDVSTQITMHPTLCDMQENATSTSLLAVRAT